PLLSLFLLDPPPTDIYTLSLHDALPIYGLARTGRDFDEAAEALSDTYFVICPDTLGRGLSSWARDFRTDYSYATFGRVAEGILADRKSTRLNSSHVKISYAVFCLKKKKE